MCDVWHQCVIFYLSQHLEEVWSFVFHPELPSQSKRFFNFHFNPFSPECPILFCFSPQTARRLWRRSFKLRTSVKTPRSPAKSYWTTSGSVTWGRTGAVFKSESDTHTGSCSTCTSMTPLSNFCLLILHRPLNCCRNCFKHSLLNYIWRNSFSLNGVTFKTPFLIAIKTLKLL